jgi:hypothetical protein
MRKGSFEEAWSRAAAWDAKAQCAYDPKVREVYERMRDCWMRIGHGEQFSQDAVSPRRGKKRSRRRERVEQARP